MHTDLHIGIRVVIWAVPVIYAITLHEVAHGAMAYYLGDDTAKRAGRLSLNPLKHIDPLGSVVVPILLFWVSGFIFGWAKPVPVNEQYLNANKRNMALVAAAGPAANLFMSILWAIIIKLGYVLSIPYAEAGLMLIYMGAAGIFINAAVMMLNMLPLPPLDGGRILVGLLPQSYSRSLSKVEPWGFIIVIVMVLSGFAATIIWPLMAVEMALVTELLDVPPDLFINALRALFA